MAPTSSLFGSKFHLMLWIVSIIVTQFFTWPHTLRRAIYLRFYLKCTLDYLRVSLICIFSFSGPRPSSLHSLKFDLQCTSGWRVLDLHLLLKWFAATICNCGLLSSSHYRLLVPTIDNVIPLIVVSLAKVTAGARLYLRATAPRKYTQHTYSVVLSTPAHHCCTGRIS